MLWIVLLHPVPQLHTEELFCFNALPNAWLNLCFAPFNIRLHHFITSLIIIIRCNTSIKLKINSCINKQNIGMLYWNHRQCSVLTVVGFAAACLQSSFTSSSPSCIDCRKGKKVAFKSTYLLFPFVIIFSEVMVIYCYMTWYREVMSKNISHWNLSQNVKDEVTLIPSRVFDVHNKT